MSCHENIMEISSLKPLFPVEDSFSPPLLSVICSLRKMYYKCQNIKISYLFHHLADSYCIPQASEINKNLLPTETFLKIILSLKIYFDIVVTMEGV